MAYHQAVLDAVDKTLIPGANNEELKGLLVKCVRRSSGTDTAPRIDDLGRIYTPSLILRLILTSAGLESAANVRKGTPLHVSGATAIYYVTDSTAYGWPRRGRSERVPGAGAIHWRSHHNNCPPRPGA